MIEFFPEPRAGDAFLHNSPYHGNTHPADHSLLVPVIDADGVHRFTVLAKAHQADCGNSVPTTYMVSARDVYEEGALIFPAVQVQRDYEDIQDILRMCEMRIRVPEQWRGDYLALVGTARIGERAVLELAEELGWSVARGVRRPVARLRRAAHGGRHRRAARRLGVGHDDPRSRPRPARRRDRRRRGAGRPGAGGDRGRPAGQPRLRALRPEPERGGLAGGGHDRRLQQHRPHRSRTTQGSFRRIHVQLRDGCVVGIPRHPASCSAATTNLANRVVNIVQRSMADIGPGIGLAEVGTGFSPVGGGGVGGRPPPRHGRSSTSSSPVPTVGRAARTPTAG